MKLSQKIAQLFFLSILALASFAQAQYPGDAFRRDGREVYSPVHPMDTKVGYVGRWVNGEKLPLMRILNIDSGDYGKMIVAINVEIRQSNGARLDLLVDNRIEDSQGTQYATVPLRPRGQLRIGQFQTLQLGVMGQVYIDRVIVHLRGGGGGGGYPPPPPSYDRQYLERHVNGQFQGQSRLDLNHLVNLQAYRGYRVVEVMMRGRTRHGNGMASVLVNNRVETQKQRVGVYSAIYTFHPFGGNVVGQDIWNLDLMMQGNFVIETVTVVVER